MNRCFKLAPTTLKEHKISIGSNEIEILQGLKIFQNVFRKNSPTTHAKIHITMNPHQKLFVDSAKNKFSLNMFYDYDLQ